MSAVLKPLLELRPMTEADLPAASESRKLPCVQGKA